MTNLHVEAAIIAKSHSGRMTLKESLIISIYKEGNKTDFSHYQVILLLSTSHKMLSNIFLPRLSLYVDEIIGDHKCVFQHNGSTTDQLFYIYKVLEDNGRVHQLYVNFKKSYDSVRKEVLNNNLIEVLQQNLNICLLQFLFKLV